MEGELQIRYITFSREDKNAEFRLWWVLPLGPDGLAEPVIAEETVANSGLAILHRLLGFWSIICWLVGTYRNSSLAIENPVDAGSYVIGYDLIQQSVKFDIHNIVPVLNCAPKKRSIWVLKMHACELTEVIQSYDISP